MNETDLVVQDLLEEPSDDTYTSKRVTMISRSLEVKELRVLMDFVFGPTSDEEI